MAVTDQKGFTLLELLVALSVAALIVLAVTTTLFSLNRANETASQEMEQQRALRTTLDLLRREISAILYQTGDKELRFMVEDRDFFGKPASVLSFCTVAPPLDGDVSDQLRVQYKPEEDGSRIKLTRASRDFFQSDTSPVRFFPQIDGLEGFLVECNDGSSWLKSWDTALTNRLPKQIRITLLISENNKSAPYQIIASPRINSQ